MELDEGGRWNIVDNTYNGDTWLQVHEKKGALFTKLNSSDS